MPCSHFLLIVIVIVIIFIKIFLKYENEQDA